MPTFVLNMIISIVIKFGIPVLIQYLLNSSKIPAEVKVVLQKLLEALKDPSIPNKEARATAHREFKECIGTACPTDLK